MGFVNGINRVSLPRYTNETVERMLTCFDEDKDRKISQKEWLDKHDKLIPGDYTDDQFEKALEKYVVSTISMHRAVSTCSSMKLSISRLGISPSEHWTRLCRDCRCR